MPDAQRGKGTVVSFTRNTKLNRDLVRTSKRVDSQNENHDHFPLPLILLLLDCTELSHGLA